jgi:hypothetical protein
VRLSTLPATNIPSQEFLSNGLYLLYSIFFDFLHNDRYDFPPAFLVCRWYPELSSSPHTGCTGSLRIDKICSSSSQINRYLQMILCHLNNIIYQTCPLTNSLHNIGDFRIVLRKRFLDNWSVPSSPGFLRLHTG